MTLTHLTRLDLNLLVHLDALLSTGSVTRAARQVGLTQSAMSRSLAKLRDELSDPLLVRSGRGMVRTPRADALAPELSRTLRELEGLILDRPGFDPATARMRFTLCTADFMEALLLPSLMAHIARHAPGIDLAIVRPDNEYARALEEGSIDLLVGVGLNRGAALVCRKLYHEDFVCLLRRGHPAARGSLTLTRFLALDHVLVTTGVGGTSAVDDALSRLGKSRRVALRVASFLAAPEVVANSDLVVTYPKRLACRAAKSLPLTMRPPPVGLSGFDVQLGWHERRRQDASHTWLRGVLTDVARKATAG